MARFRKLMVRSFQFSQIKENRRNVFEEKVGQKQEAQREIGGGKGNREGERVGRVKYIQTLIIEMSERERERERERGSERD